MNEQLVACNLGSDAPALDDTRAMTGWATYSGTTNPMVNPDDLLRFRVLFKSGFYAWEMQLQRNKQWFIVPENGTPLPVWQPMAPWMLTTPLEEVGLHCGRRMMANFGQRSDDLFLELIAWSSTAEGRG